MFQNQFQVNDTFYEQKEVTVMGNPSSIFIDNLVMSKVKTDLKKDNEYFPNVWFRKYVTLMTFLPCLILRNRMYKTFSTCPELI